MKLLLKEQSDLCIEKMAIIIQYQTLFKITYRYKTIK